MNFSFFILQLTIEEQKRENSGLIRQLEQSIADSRRLEEESREKALARERNSQARILDLEAQHSRVKSELIQNRRQKEDVSNQSYFPLKQKENCKNFLQKLRWHLIEVMFKK